jgi:hypothetical protein
MGSGSGCHHNFCGSRQGSEPGISDADAVGALTCCTAPRKITYRENSFSSLSRCGNESHLLRTAATQFLRYHLALIELG